MQHRATAITLLPPRARFLLLVAQLSHRHRYRTAMRWMPNQGTILYLPHRHRTRMFPRLVLIVFPLTIPLLQPILCKKPMASKAKERRVCILHGSLVGINHSKAALHPAEISLTATIQPTMAQTATDSPTRCKLCQSIPREVLYHRTASHSLRFGHSQGCCQRWKSCIFIGNFREILL